MYQPPNETGTYTRFTATGVQTAGQALPIALLGISVGSTVSSQIFGLWSQTSVLTGLPVHSSMILAANTFTRLPAYLPKGLVINPTSETVDITIYWNPAD